MTLTDLLVLPSDVAIDPASALPPLSRPANDATAAPAAGEAFAVGRRRSRSRALLVDADAAALIEEFRAPSTVADAVLRASAARGVDPDRLLDDAYPLLKRLVSSRLLAP